MRNQPPLQRLRFSPKRLRSAVRPRWQQWVVAVRKGTCRPPRWHPNLRRGRCPRPHAGLSASKAPLGKRAASVRARGHHRWGPGAGGVGWGARGRGRDRISPTAPAVPGGWSPREAEVLLLSEPPEKCFCLSPVDD